MRDQEFLQAMREISPIIAARFARLIRGAGIQTEREELKKDLVQMTMLFALQNSWKENCKHLSCRELIFIKAKNVWADFYNYEFKNSFNGPNYEKVDLSWNDNTKSGQDSSDLEKIQMILDFALPIEREIINKRLEGYSNREIGDLFHKSEAAITMHIQRLKNRIRKHQK